MRDLGSPVHTPELFQRVTEKMAVQIFVIYTQDKPTAAALDAEKRCGADAASFLTLRYKSISFKFRALDFRGL